MASAVARGRAAFGHRQWGDAYASLAEVSDSLDAGDLERFAVCAYLVGQDSRSEEVWARAHHAHLVEGDAPRAARCAFFLGHCLQVAGDMARGNGWIARATAVLEGHDECAEHGLVLVGSAFQSMVTGEAAAALAGFDQAARIGTRFADPDAVAFGCLGRGLALIALDETASGIASLDESMVALTADGVSPITVGIVYCAVILACEAVFDLGRAREWTAALGRWCDDQPDLVPFRGQCLVHRADILRMDGYWPEAEAAAQRACHALAGRPAVARAWYSYGELHRLRGELDESERAYHQAHSSGLDPQPGLALLRLAQGRGDAAAVTIRRALDEAVNPAPRARLLPAAVEIFLAVGDVGAANDSALELEASARELHGSLLWATSRGATAAVLLAQDRPRDALALLREAAALWVDLGARYELARTRVSTAAALAAIGDDSSASLELEAARETFEQLGAMPDLRAVERLTAAAEAKPFGLTARELQVLHHVVNGRTNREIAEELVLSEHTVRRHIQNIFTKVGVTTRAGATAFAIRHDLA